MKRSLSVVFFLLLSSVSWGQCPTGTIFLNNQAQVNQFLATYPNCTSLTQGINIGNPNGSNISDISGFSQFTSASSFVSIINTQLTTLNGLQNIVFQPGAVLGFSGNNQLASFEFAGSPVSQDFGIRLIGSNLPSLSSLPEYQVISGISFQDTNFIDFSGLENITSITASIFVESNPNLISFNGLNIDIFGDNPTGVVKVTNNSSLQSIDMEPTSGTGKYRIEIRNNPMLQNLAGLEIIETASEITLVNNNSLTNLMGLEGIIQVDEVSIRDNDSLQNLLGLQGVELGVVDFFTFGLNITNNQSLTTFGGLTSETPVIGALRIQDNPLLNSLDGLEGITNIDGSVEVINNASLQNLNGLINAAQIDDGFLRPFILTDNPSLTDISGIEDFTFTNSPFTIQNNVNLEVCNVQSVCDFLASNNAQITIDNNAPGCNTVLDVIIACGLDINIVRGLVQFDFENDGCDPDDIAAPNVLVRTTDGVNSFSTFTNSTGNYQNFIDMEGVFSTFVVEECLPPYYEVSPESQESNFVGFQNEDIVDFCLTASESINDLMISLIPLDQPAPGFDSGYKLVYENIGTTIQNVEVTLQFEDSRQNFINASPAPDNITGNIVTWTFTDLQPFESGEIEITLNTLPPPANEIGEIIRLEGRLAGDEGDESPVNNRSVLEQIIVGSFDPNDKIVAQGKYIYEEDLEDYIDFVVRFQNTGTADAKDVVITDTLSNNLNWNTIRMLGASHDYRVEILNENAVSFIFEDIDLPPESIDPEGSNGYVAFQIRPSEDLQLNDYITNTANIFFDFNPPIITNTTETQYVANIPDCPNGTILLSSQLEVDNFASEFSNCDLSNVDIKISGPDITNLDGLQSLSAIGGKLTIINNPILTSLDGMGALEFTGENAGLLIENNQSLDSLTDFEGILNSALGITIFNNPSLTSLAGFEEILASENVIISNNSGLANLDGLSGLTDVDGAITIEANALLTDISALEGVDPFNIDVWTITNNINLSVCDLTSLCTFIDNNGETIISNNATGCATEEDVREACELLEISEFNLAKGISIYPNPVASSLQVHLSPGLELLEVKIHSILGEEIETSGVTEIDFSAQASGIYFVTVVTNKGYITKKLIKL